MILFSIIAFVSLLVLGVIAYQGHTSEKANNKFKTIYNNEHEEKNENKNELLAINPDYVGWLEIPNTSISFPIVQYKDNKYYLKRNFYKEYDYYGTPFSDYRSTSDLTIIYGHNMRTRQMFGTLPKLYTTKIEGEKHKILSFNNSKYSLVGAAYIIDGEQISDKGFTYNNYFCCDDDYINAICKKLLYQEEDVITGDELMILSTCSYNQKEERFIVIFKKSLT